ncbi:MAG: hypothetical protein ACHQET_13755 [Chitinophagales bacterium]
MKGLQVQRMRQVMLEEFNPKYPGVDDYNAEQVFRLVHELYARYEERIK